jgi:hypothetical protein
MQLMKRELFSSMYSTYIEARRLSYAFLKRHSLLDRAYAGLLRQWLHSLEWAIISKVVKNPAIIDGHRFFLSARR